MKHLLAISIGPVQEFIAAARRTADLYAGSQLLVEIAREVTQTLEKNGASMIFPASSESDGPNKILVVVDNDPRTVADDAKRAAQQTLKGFWTQAFKKLSPAQQGHVDLARADAQISSFLEVYAAWWPLESDGQYGQARKHVDRLLAGRKALRDFAPLHQDDAGMPKSPLDPSRASVIGSRVDQVFVDDKKLRLRKTEFLDANSLLKRVYGADDRSGKVLQTRTLARLCKNLEAKNSDLLEDDDQTPEPQPYYAILVADGDRMGELLSIKSSRAEHQEISRRLAGFAEDAERIVKTHRGFLVYSGGDDVMAMLPVNQAIACAKELSDQFRHVVRGTLSAGVAIVHYREPLSMSLEHARSAEKAAKNKADKNKSNHGNRLAVALHTRGGSPVTVVDTWDDLAWDTLKAAYTPGGITRGVAYEFRELAREWPEIAGSSALQAEARRILERKESNGLKLPEFQNARDLEHFADKLVIARFLSGLEGEGSKGGETNG